MIHIDVNRLPYSAIRQKRNRPRPSTCKTGAIEYFLLLFLLDIYRNGATWRAPFIFKNFKNIYVHFIMFASLCCIPGFPNRSTYPVPLSNEWFYGFKTYNFLFINRALAQLFYIMLPPFFGCVIDHRFFIVKSFLLLSCTGLCLNGSTYLVPPYGLMGFEISVYIFKVSCFCVSYAGMIRKGSTYRFPPFCSYRWSPQPMGRTMSGNAWL